MGRILSPGNICPLAYERFIVFIAQRLKRILKGNPDGTRSILPQPRGLLHEGNTRLNRPPVTPQHRRELVIYCLKIITKRKKYLKAYNYTNEFSCVLWYINLFRLFDAKSCLYIYIYRSSAHEQDVTQGKFFSGV